MKRKNTLVQSKKRRKNGVFLRIFYVFLCEKQAFFNDFLRFFNVFLRFFQRRFRAFFQNTAARFMQNIDLVPLFLRRFFIGFFRRIRLEHKRDSFQNRHHAKHDKHRVNHIPFCHDKQNAHDKRHDRI